MVGGEPNFSFRGKWQREQRCRKNPSPRFSCSVNFEALDDVEAGLVCALKSVARPEHQHAKPRTLVRARAEILVFTIRLSRLRNAAPVGSFPS